MFFWYFNDISNVHVIYYVKGSANITTNHKKKSSNFPIFPLHCQKAADARPGGLNKTHQYRSGCEMIRIIWKSSWKFDFISINSMWHCKYSFDFRLSRSVKCIILTFQIWWANKNNFIKFDKQLIKSILIHLVSSESWEH